VDLAIDDHHPLAQILLPGVAMGHMPCQNSLKIFYTDSNILCIKVHFNRLVRNRAGASEQTSAELNKQDLKIKAINLAYTKHRSHIKKYFPVKDTSLLLYPILMFCTDM
jgi:hypothetical protein